MRDGIFPLFTKGRVLKRESIEYLRDFPHDLAVLAFDGYADGILFGFTIEFSAKQRHLIISKGAVKHQDNIVIIPKETIVPVSEDYCGHLVYIKLFINNYYETEDKKTCDIDISLDEDDPSSSFLASHSLKIELGRFHLNSSAILRCQHESFADLFTPENTIGITCVPYAGLGATTLHPVILQEYANKLMQISSEPVDMSFAMTCFNTSVVHKRAIQWYIAKKCGNKYKDYPLLELSEKLREILLKQELGELPEEPKRRRATVS